MLALWLLVGTTTWAGVDDIRVVTKLVGQAQVRGAMRRNHHAIKSVQWSPLKLGDIVFPKSEIRTRTHSRLWLQLGDQKANAARLPTDMKILYDVLEPNTLVRLNSQHTTMLRYNQSNKHTRILQVVRGKASQEVVRGQIPLAQYYKNAAWYKAQFAKSNPLTAHHP